MWSISLLLYLFYHNFYYIDRNEIIEIYYTVIQGSLSFFPDTYIVNFAILIFYFINFTRSSIINVPFPPDKCI